VESLVDPPISASPNLVRRRPSHQWTATRRVGCHPPRRFSLGERQPSNSTTQRVTLHPIDSQSPDDLHAFRDERGFFRARTEERPDPLADFEIEAGPPLSPEDARREVRRFLDALADGRPILEQHDDPLEFAQRNGLLLLIGPEEEHKLAAIGRRMPRDMAVGWRDALRGGSASDAFGPLSEPERLDEKRVEAELRSGDSRRRRSLLIGGAALLVVVAIVGVLLVRRGGDDDTAGSISFAPTDEAEEQGDLREGPPPSVVPALVARLDRAVAVAPGDGPVADRVVLDPPAEDLPVPIGAVAATLVRYNGSGQVVLVGPEGWLANACIQVSPIAESLRPFEMAFHETAQGACPDWVYGREAT